MKRQRDHGQGYAWRYWVKWLWAAEVLPRGSKLGRLVRTLTMIVPICGRYWMKRLMGSRWPWYWRTPIDSEHNHRLIHQKHGADSIIPAKRGKANGKLQSIQVQMRADFLAELCAPRNLIGTFISVVKRKLSARVPGRTVTTQRLQALLP